MDSKTQLSECRFKKEWIPRPNFQNADSGASRREPVPFLPLDLIQSQLICDLLGHAGDIPTGSCSLWPSCWVLMWEAAEVATGKASERANAANPSEGQTKLIRPTKPSPLAGGWGALGSSWQRFTHFRPLEDAVRGIRAPCSKPQSAWSSEAFGHVGTRGIHQDQMRIWKTSDHFSREDFLFTFQS